MLAIRLQRVGRSGLAQYRIIVQEAQRHPTSGRVVAFVGTYNPHTKDCKIQVETAQKFLDNGAQPSPRVIKLLTAAGIKMPSWVVKTLIGNKATKKSDKLRKNQPVEAASATEEAIVEDIPAEAPTEKPAEETASEPTEAPAAE